MDGMYIREDSLIIKLLFLKDSSTLCYSSSLSIFLHCFSDLSLMEGLLHYIEFSKSSPSYSCSSSNPALKYVSYQASSLALYERQWLRPLFRGLLHINAVRKVVAVHLMRWWQLFPKIFLYPYLLRTCLKSILIVRVSWKITQVTRMLARMIFVRSEEVTSSNLSPPLFPYATIYSGTSPVIYSSSDASPSANRARSNVQIQAFSPTIYLLDLENEKF